VCVEYREFVPIKLGEPVATTETALLASSDFGGQGSDTTARSPGGGTEELNGRRDTAAPRRRFSLLLAGVLGIAALFAAALGVMFLRDGSDTDIAQTMRDAGCTYKSVVERKEVRHVSSLPAGYRYTTNPRTTGVHYPETILWGAYDDPVDQLRIGHNMEHGGVAIQYGERVSESAIRELLEFYRDDPNGLVVAPLSRLGNRIAVAAWTFDLGRLNEQRYEGEGKLALCPGFDEKAIAAFVDAYRGVGAERIPVESLAPGNP
jgi:hypothetical protein